MSADMLDVDDSTKIEFDLLRQRVLGLGRHLRWLVPVGAVLVGGSILAFGGQALIGLDAQPAQIDIPADLLLKFSDAPASMGGGDTSEGLGGVFSLFGVLGAIANVMATWMPPIASALGGLGAIIAFLCGRTDDAMRCMFSAVIIGGASYMVATVFTHYTGPDPATEKSERQQFVQAASDQRNLPWSESLLKKLKQDQTPQGLYVLAQVQLSGSKKWTEPVVKFTPELVDTITSPSAGFTPSGAALYAIETAAYGEAKSAAAIAQVEAVQERKGKITTLGSILGVLGIIAGTGAGLIGALRRKLKARADRIERMLRGLS